MTGTLLTERNGGVLRVTLNDPATRNALSLDMLHEIGEALALVEADHDVRVIVFAALGLVFSSGHNLKDMTAHRTDDDRGDGYFARVFNACADIMVSISTHRCATIAEVDGLASAAGCQLVAACDLAYASPRASFCTPGVNIGLFCSTPMVALSRVTAPKHTMEMLLTGDVYSAAHALRIGLVNDVIPQNELRSHVAAVAGRIAEKSGAAIGVGKKLFQKQAELPLREAYLVAAKRMTQNMLDRDAVEGIGAFLEKRKAEWSMP
jgi:enoyl-CoA hydratase/carnithine racemase